MADNILEIQARADFSQLFGESQAAAASVEDSSKRIKTAMDSAGDAPKKLEYSFMEARHAAAGFGEEVGIRIPRVLATALAHSETLGPILASAFSVVAVGMFVQVLEQVPAVIDKIIGKFTGWDESAKKTYQHILEGNTALIASNIKMNAQIAAIGTIGLQGTAKYAAEIANAKTETEAWAVTSKMAGDRIRDIQMQIELLKAPMMPGISPMISGGVLSKAVGYWNTIGSTIKDLESDLARFTSLQDQATEAMRRSGAVEQPRLAKEGQQAAIEAADRAAKEAARIQHEQIIAELNDAERAAKEKTKLLTEEAKENEAANKSMDAEQKKGAEELAALKIRLMRMVTEENNRQVREQERMEKELQRPWDQLAKNIQRTMTQTTMGLIEGTLTVQKAFMKLGEGILQIMVNALAKVLAQHIAHAIMVNVVEKSQMAASLAAYLGYYSTKLATAKTAEVAQGSTDAGLAGAAAYASVMEALPFPLNIAVAPGVAAEAITATMALASFATGTDYVPRTGLALLHEGEAVTPASQNRSGSVHLHIHAVDAAGVSDFFERNQDKITRTLQRGMRKRNSF